MKYQLLVPLCFLTLVTSAITLFVPIKSEATEFLVDVSVTTCGGLVLGCFIVVSLRRTWKGDRLTTISNLLESGLAILLGVFVLFGIAVYLPYVHRQHRRAIIEPSLAGTVIRLYRSDNHQYASVEVKQKNGEVVRLEGISERTWELLQPGMQISKDEWDAEAAINGTTALLAP